MISRSALLAHFRHAWGPLLVLALLAALPVLAQAHAHPDTLSPAPDATLNEAPSRVTMVFTEELEPAFSTLKVTDQQGDSVTRTGSHVIADQPDTLVAPLRKLKPGSYQVHWHVVARDGHTTHGEYHFRVRQQQ